jgi:hypothetical protein
MLSPLFGGIPGRVFLKALTDGEPAAWVMLAGVLLFAGLCVAVKYTFRR